MTRMSLKKLAVSNRSRRSRTTTTTTTTNATTNNSNTTTTATTTANASLSSLLLPSHSFPTLTPFGCSDNFPAAASLLLPNPTKYYYCDPNPTKSTSTSAATTIQEEPEKPLSSSASKPPTTEISEATTATACYCAVTAAATAVVLAPKVASVIFWNTPSRCRQPSRFSTIGFVWSAVGAGAAGGSSRRYHRDYHYSYYRSPTMWMGRYSVAAVAAPFLVAFFTSTSHHYWRSSSDRTTHRTYADAPSSSRPRSSAAMSKDPTTSPPATTTGINTGGIDTSKEYSAEQFRRKRSSTGQQNQYHPSSSSSCPFYGCPIHPADVHYNTEAVKAILQRIRDLPAEQVTESVLNHTTTNDDDDDDHADLPRPSSTRDWNRRDAVSLTLIGYKGGPLLQQINQDRAVVVAPFLVSSTSSTTLNHDETALSPNQQPTPGILRSSLPPVNHEKDRVLLGVFDGHGTRGELVSEYTAQLLPVMLSQKLRNLPTVLPDRKVATVRALHDTFVELDELSPADPSGGCTATTILRQEESIYIANAGDSRSFVVAYRPSTRKVQVLYISREDKPDLPDEKARVEAMGGQVYIPKRGTSRVVYQDPLTGTPSGLAMSRSIGDWAAAKLGVIPDPIVDVLEIPDLIQTVLKNEVMEQCFVVDENGEVDRNECNERLAAAAVAEDDVYLFGVAATDGMMDYLSPHEIAKVLASSLFERGASHPVTACELLIFSAANSWQRDKQGRYRDDIAIAVSVLRKPPSSSEKETTTSYGGRYRRRPVQPSSQ